MTLTSTPIPPPGLRAAPGLTDDTEHVVFTARTQTKTFFATLDSGSNDNTTNQQIDAEDGRPLPAPLWDAGNRQHPAVSVGTLKATVSNADIDLNIETRHTPSIGETLISAARLVDEKDCKIR